MRNGSLRFPRLKEEDETFYLCSASNGIGEISKAIFLKVHSKSLFSITLAFTFTSSVSSCIVSQTAMLFYSGIELSSVML